MFCHYKFPLQFCIDEYTDIYMKFTCSWQGVLDTTLCDKVCQWLAAGRWFSPMSSTNKTDCHDIVEILLKMVLNTITLTPYMKFKKVFPVCPLGGLKGHLWTLSKNRSKNCPVTSGNISIIAVTLTFRKYWLFCILVQCQNKACVLWG